MTVPYVRKLEANTPVTTIAQDSNVIVGKAPWACTVTSVEYIPVSTMTGTTDGFRTFTLFNRGAAGTGTVPVATHAMVSGSVLADNVASSITLATAANLTLASGDVLEWNSDAISTGIIDPGGKVIVTLSRL